ncbi:hypothetical protein [Ponticaulis sp.]|uniref:hypothetical protein n=1 Tax=Ponticaulis sp. TaxID=2020902 RepID=UPI000B7655C1|nr:hypothetical protein [Ponticaulis sp.]MAI89121.1 hypothetical protein [Ponticaulis sp.]OUY01120.1 MAG: hypothetical protein CBB65_01385 [Hyphomonadaceae bacterium TMED5]|tara:strand:+ start:150647 stop:151678 length:1032 start_codon:yes stop_codon:yes gene_type:complete
MSELGLIFKASEGKRCDSYRLGGAIVDYDAITSKWRMWYYCRDRGFDGPPTLGTGYIAHAISDDGVSWTRVEGKEALGSVLAPNPDKSAFDSVHVGLTDITRGAGEWLMWYFGGDTRPQKTEAPFLGDAVVGLGMRPGLARSKDGVEWERVPGPRISGALFDYPDEDMYAAWPNVIFDGRRYIMQYTSPTLDLSYFHTHTAVSDDGLNWTRSDDLFWADGGRPYDEGGIVTRQILLNPIPDGRRFLMVYTATDKYHGRSVAAAESDDGLAWYHLYDEPIFNVGETDAWDAYGVAANRLVAVGDKLYFYYYGFQSLGADDAMRGIGLATCQVGDLRRLQRYDTR